MENTADKVLNIISCHLKLPPSQPPISHCQTLSLFLSIGFFYRPFDYAILKALFSLLVVLLVFLFFGNFHFFKLFLSFAILFFFLAYYFLSFLFLFFNRPFCFWIIRSFISLSNFTCNNCLFAYVFLLLSVNIFFFLSFANYHHHNYQRYSHYHSYWQNQTACCSALFPGYLLCMHCIPTNFRFFHFVWFVAAGLLCGSHFVNKPTFGLACVSLPSSLFIIPIVYMAIYIF